MIDAQVVWDALDYAFDAPSEAHSIFAGILAERGHYRTVIRKAATRLETMELAEERQVAKQLRDALAKVGERPVKP